MLRQPVVHLECAGRNGGISVCKITLWARTNKHWFGSFFRRRTSSSKINSGRNDSERHLKFYKQTNSLQRLPVVIAKKRIEDTGPEAYIGSKHPITSTEKILLKRRPTFPFVPCTPSSPPILTRSISLPSSLHYTKLNEIASSSSFLSDDLSYARLYTLQDICVYAYLAKV